jgi:adenylylsulfate kinase-like enzyme
VDKERWPLFIERNATQNERGFTLWFTGLSGAGKTTVSEIVEKELRARLEKVEVLDGDIVRTNLSRGLLGSSVCAARSARKPSSTAT